MKIYVASSWKNQLQSYVVEALREIGHEVYDFKNPKPGERGFSWSKIDPDYKDWDDAKYLLALKHPEAEAGFGLDWAAMEWADTGVLVLPCGRSAHIEAGYFAGAKKNLFIMLGNENPVIPELMYKMATAVFPGVASLTQALKMNWGPRNE